jgi:hypothetical protein
MAKLKAIPFIIIFKEGEENIQVAAGQLSKL